MRSESNTGPPLLIVNADDFGMTDGISRGVLRAFENGIVTSTSALAVAPAFARNAAALRGTGIGVGGHLAAVGEDPPLLTRREIPSLVDPSGRFPANWQAFLRRAAAGRVDTDDLRREFGAQIDRLTGAGLRLTHLDSHQNLHLWPQMATVVIELARDRSIAAVRVPRTIGLGPIALGVRVLSAALARRAAAAGLEVPATSIGLDEIPGPHVDGAIVAMDRMSATGGASAELVVHLGEQLDPERSRYASRLNWSEQLATMCDPSVVRHAESGFRLGSFADLGTRRGREAVSVPGGPTVAPRGAQPSVDDVSSTVVPVS